MAEYIAREDVIDIIRSAGFWEKEDMEVAITCVEQTQDADVAPVVHGPSAVKVVRCKDCKHYKEFRTKRYKQIMRFCYRMGKHDMEYPVKPYDFCSYGERRDDNG